MTVNEAIDIRRSRRAYTDAPLPADKIETLNKLISKINEKEDLSFKLVVNNPAAFGDFKSSYGFFSGVKNYIVVAGQKSENLLVRLGYFGERIVLEATRLGLATCWVGGTFDKKSVGVPDGSVLYGVITVGFANESKTLKEKVIASAVRRKTKSVEQMAEGLQNAPQWFADGMKALQKAPSAVNGQPVTVRYDNGNVTASVNAKSNHQSVDLGIAMYHFETGAGGGTWVLKNSGNFTKQL